jgi:NAD(P)-dependent dehydrogenase (short-subunit alcohol dehydrogenase family)
MNKPICAIVGVGPGNGAAFARKFAAAGYRLALIARGAEVAGELAKQLDGSQAYLCDIADQASVDTTFAAIRRDMGEVDTLIYNAGAGLWRNIEEISADDFEQSWRVNALGSLLASKQVIPAMKQHRRGNIIFIGATASRRGNVMTAAFAPAKAAQKSLAESMARHLGPSGIHIALVVIDGVVDTPATGAMFPEKSETFFTQPDDIAETVLHLASQKRSAWSFEIEVRPYAEKW